MSLLTFCVTNTPREELRATAADRDAAATRCAALAEECAAATAQKEDMLATIKAMEAERSVASVARNPSIPSTRHLDDGVTGY